jgi:hypothetical protein
MTNSHWSVFVKRNDSKSGEQTEEPKVTGEAWMLIVEDPV